MKLNGIFGTGSGKTGNAVFATSAGKQIVRTYQPKVSNPNTDAQIQQRAKFKLLSQLAAAMAPVIVIPKDGLTSARNRFVKMNYPLTDYTNEQATVDLKNIQVTDSQVPLVGIQASYDASDQVISAASNLSLFPSFDKVAYSLFKVTEGAKLQLVEVKVVDIDGMDSEYGRVMFSNVSSGDYVLYAYGMKAKNTNSRSNYYNYEVDGSTSIASLDTILTLSLSNYVFSMTVGIKVNAA